MSNEREVPWESLTPHLQWFACVSKYNLEDTVVDVECLHRVEDIASVRARTIEDFSGIEIMLKNGARIFTDTYDVRSFAMNVLGTTSMLDAIE